MAEEFIENEIKPRLRATLERIAHELEIKASVSAEMLDENIPKRMGESPICTVIGFGQVPSETETCGALILAQYANDERIIGSAADEDWGKFARVLSTLPKKRIETIVDSLAKDESSAYTLGEMIGKLPGPLQRAVVMGMAGSWPGNGAEAAANDTQPSPEPPESA